MLHKLTFEQIYSTIANIFQLQESKIKYMKSEDMYILTLLSNVLSTGLGNIGPSSL